MRIHLAVTNGAIDSFFVLETMQMRDNFLSLNLCLKRHDRTTTTRASSFFFIFLEVIESVSFCCEKAKYIKNYGWRQNVFILHVPEDIAYKARMIIILWGGTGEVEAVKNVVALYRIYILHKLHYSFEGCCNSTAAAPVVVLSSVFE